MIKLKKGWKLYNLVLASFIVNCYSQKTFVLHEKLDFDESVDTLKYSIGGNVLKGQIITSNNIIFFEVGNDEDLETQIILFPQEITLFTGVDVAGGSERQSVYSYDESLKSWIYSRHLEIIHNIDNGISAPEIEFSYEDGETETIDGIKVNYISKKPLKGELNDLVVKAKNGVYDGSRIIEYLYNFPINKENVEDYNNLAYFLKGDDIALYILEKLIEAVPSRVVAYLNLADTYYELGNEEKAKEYYKTYIAMMKKQKKDLKRIPKYVYARIK